MLITTSFLDVRTVHRVPLARVFDEIVKNEQFQIAQELKNNIRDENFFYQYRVISTPTL